MDREEVLELLDKDDDVLESFCSEPDELDTPVMSGSDDEFSDLEQEDEEGIISVHIVLCNARIIQYTICRVYCSTKKETHTGE